MVFTDVLLRNGLRRQHGEVFTSILISFPITVLLTLAAWIGIAVYRRKKPPLPHFILFGCLLTPVLFVPGCVVTDLVVKAIVWRELHYATAAELSPGSLPPAACDITIRPGDVSAQYRFKIPRKDLVLWLDDFKARYRNNEAFRYHEAPDSDAEGMHKEDRAAMREWIRSSIQSSFGRTGWPIPEDLKMVGRVTIAANGAGLSVWYSRREGVAYCEVNSR